MEEAEAGRAGPLARVESPSHQIHTEKRDTNGHVITLDGGTTMMDRAIVLNLTPARQTQPCAQAGRGPDGQSFVAVTFIPEFEDDLAGETQPTETIFVLDCSGSMSGESIEHARNALQLCLRSLSEGDTFNICRFGSTFELMTPQAVAYTQQSLEDALAYVASIDADLGGTELHAPLNQVLSSSFALFEALVGTPGRSPGRPASASKSAKLELREN